MNYRLFFKLTALFVTLLIIFSVADLSITSTQAKPPDQTPTVFIASQATPTATPKDQHTTLLFTGDINPGRCIALKTMASRDYAYPFDDVAEKLKSADITVGSLDGSLSDQSIPMSCPYSMNLIGPSRMVEGMKLSGFDVMTVATNHSGDCGEKGFDCHGLALMDTIQNLTLAGIRPVGGGQNLEQARAPVIITHNNIRFAFLGINQIEQNSWAQEDKPGTAPLSPEFIETIKQDIASARSKADVVIVLAQWGSEYNTRPNPIQRVWAKEFIDAGATLIIGNQPHITQPIEYFQNGIVFYSLGNFVFDQPKPPQRESVVVEATFNGAQLESWKLLPAFINYYTFQVHWADAANGLKILERASVMGN